MRYLTLSLSLLGILILFLGAFFGDKIDSFPFIPFGSGDAILRIGSAILGAGIFAAIMKSAQFSNIFQKHIYDVFYNPDKIITGLPLISKWTILTNSLLKEVLPHTYHKAANIIQKSFFNSELDYHFENYIASYEIVVKNNIATVNCTVTSNLIISPLSHNPIFKHSIDNSDGVKLKALILNDDSSFDNYPYIKDENYSNKYNQCIPLGDYICIHDNGEKKVQFERIIEWNQNLIEDPCIVANISRYIKGAKVKIKMDDNYKIHFKNVGLQNESNKICNNKDGAGYQRCTLVSADDLLLPGQSYIIIMVPIK